MNEQLTTAPDGRTTLHMERRLPHPPAKVWRALTEPAHLAQWFPAEMRIDGDQISYGFGPDGKVTELDPPRLLAHTWGEDELRWEVRPDGDGSVLTLAHTFGDRFGGASFAAGWHTCVQALARLLDGLPATAPADMGLLHEHYIAILGLTSGTTQGDTTRVERQLTRPADQVWQALDGDHATPGTPPPAPFTIPTVPPGPVHRAEPGKLLEYATADGMVRWELAEGTGHGARLILTHTGETAALPAWRAHIENLATTLAHSDTPPA
ncbi:SRPBCC family protein [Nonomuraea sp. NPDC048916]|uniref:SRPBCC family protein n=1 Tax=Nonomuraea sp. NPDC048916 TaxID=3154232 RepID=UPI0033C3F009